jgi:hypothetical protein
MNQDDHTELENRIRNQIQHDVKFIFEDAEVEPWDDNQIKHFINCHQRQIKLVIDTIISQFGTIQNFFTEGTREDMNEFISEYITYPNPE